MQSERLVYRMIIACVVGLFVCLVGYAFTRPAFRLRVDMPPQFLDASSSLSPQKRAAEEKVARAYWNCVVTVIQRNYSFGQPLPASPPPQFRIASDSAVGSKKGGARLRYWRRLQRVWYLRSIWTAERTVDFGLLTQAMRSVGLQRAEYYADVLLARLETALQDFRNRK